MTELLVHPGEPAPDGTVIAVTPRSAGWRYVGFELLALAEGVRAARETGAREVAIIAIAGRVDVASAHGEWPAVGGRQDPWSGLPDGAYLPPGTAFELRAAGGPCEVALCFAPAREGAAARLLPAAAVVPEQRGYGAQERTIHPILMAEGGAEALLVTEVLTPAGHWSSYPPHRHDRDALPQESYLEETYYHRIDPPHGFAIQRVYTDDRSLDAALVVGDRDVVLVPRGYHPVAAPPGYRSYYLNVMAGPTRAWVFHNDPAHEWLLTPPAPSGGAADGPRRAAT
jgi:5-deoxy-glucuronate isomerase